ncbi:sialin-like isoform X1 [Centruroides sculpturatus]|uniref:sialin-like isoform X1 n=2 Tax=Centruroides sculpturatus TaxID=218467 RepID=UPI000C6D2DD8|nr:sialin-like isoform X1 [Centruroides sculpturatus]XP_023217875.1 sialin-like isoform X1 [Centruroides sculpturatus]XP_023217882.1 sialin-like isoform X1 [Centruroides sculpturatus]XP_023217886.1 sialin-like isoform X1 [Centruroides sculpturatus]
MKQNVREGKTLYKILPARYVLVFFIFLVCMEMYAHRVVLNVAIVAMVNNSAVEMSETENTLPHECPDSAENQNITYNYREGKFVWSQPEQGIILGSFYYGYVIFQFLGGSVVHLLGAKRTYVITVFFSSALLSITPLLAELGVAALTCQRVVLGVLQGLTYPSGFTILSRWSPVNERSTLMAICVSGNLVGSIISMTLSGYLCEYGFSGGWPSTFYVFGIYGCVLSLGLLFFVYDYPEEFSGITQKEILHIQQNSNNNTNNIKNQKIPWKSILTSVPVWATCIVKMLFAWGFYTFLSKLPSYLENILHFPIQQNGLINAFMYSANTFGLIISGYLSDLFIKRKYFSVTNVRKGFETLSIIGTSACMICIPLVGCDSTNVIIILVMTTGFMGLVGGGDNSIILNLAPKYTGPLFGLTNGMAAVSGFLSPYIAGLFLDKNQGSMVQWSYVYYLSAGFCLLGMVIFLVFGSAELQPWADNDSDEAEEEKKVVSVSK